MNMKRTESPYFSRTDIPVHQRVAGCRAEGLQDMEVRMRSIEEQSTLDHDHFVQLAGCFERMESSLYSKIREIDTRSLEFQELGFRFQQNMAAVSHNVDGSNAVLAGNLESGLSVNLAQRSAAIEDRLKSWSDEVDKLKKRSLMPANVARSTYKRVSQKATFCDHKMASRSPASSTRCKWTSRI